MDPTEGSAPVARWLAVDVGEGRGTAAVTTAAAATAATVASQGGGVAAAFGVGAP